MKAFELKVIYCLVQIRIEKVNEKLYLFLKQRPRMDLDEKFIPRPKFAQTKGYHCIKAYTPKGLILARIKILKIMSFFE